MKICSFETCDRPMHAKNYCEPHYRQSYDGRELGKIRNVRSKGSTSLRDVIGRKECLGCLRWLDESEFGKDHGTSDGLRVRCKLCKLLLLNKIEFSTYTTVLTSQENKCAVCKEDASVGLVIDHDHTCCPDRYSCGKCFRGLLCNNCNFAEGLLRSNPTIVANLLEYVKNGAIK